MFKIDTSKRTSESEIMDDFDLQGEELGKTLNDLDNINSWLGGNKITINGVGKILQESSPKNTIRIADIGCGNGAMLRKLAEWGRRNGYSFELIGIDANTHAIAIGEDLSADYPEIKYKSLNIFSDEFRNLHFDIILCTLTLHHFKDQEIIDLLNQLYGQVKKGIIINDLHRSSAAYILFQAFCGAFVNNEIARKDGLISILRGFKKSDLNSYKEQIPGKNHSIKWRWAFRYQWIIEKEPNHV